MVRSCIYSPQNLRTKNKFMLRTMKTTFLNSEIQMNKVLLYADGPSFIYFLFILQCWGINPGPCTAHMVEKYSYIAL